jgi:hypothetical protein
MASSHDDEEFPPLSVEIARLSNSFPFSAGGPPGRALDLLFEYLPEQPRAWSLCETYMEHCSWQFRPINREEIIDDFLTPIYKSLREKRNWNEDTDFPHTISPHRMAVLFMLFGLGALVDLTLDPRKSFSELAEPTYTHRSLQITWNLNITIMPAAHRWHCAPFSTRRKWLLYRRFC